MKKIIIPTILAATILVAGMFAMMPVEKASTIHSGFSSGTTSIVRDNVIINGINLAANERLIIVDNAGIGGLSDVEITIRDVAPGVCNVQTLAAGVWTTQVTAAFPVTVGGELLVPQHVDVANVDAVSLFAGAGGCILGTTNEYISVSTVGT